MPASTLTLCQSRLYPPVRDFGFALWVRSQRLAFDRGKSEEQQIKRMFLRRNISLFSQLWKRIITIIYLLFFSLKLRNQLINTSHINTLSVANYTLWSNTLNYKTRPLLIVIFIYLLAGPVFYYINPWNSWKSLLPFSVTLFLTSLFPPFFSIPAPPPPFNVGENLRSISHTAVQYLPLWWTIPETIMEKREFPHRENSEQATESLIFPTPIVK